MPRVKQQTDRKRHTDIFTISGGALGPVPACELQIRPFTVFVGAQGSGKSLVAQTLYAFEELPYLMGYVMLERGANRRDSLATFDSILARLRSRGQRGSVEMEIRIRQIWTAVRPRNGIIRPARELVSPLPREHAVLDSGPGGCGRGPARIRG